MNELDVPIPALFREAGTRKLLGLERAECEQAIARRCRHSLGLSQISKWAVEARPHHVPVAHAFWHDTANGTPELPTYGHDGLRSATRHGLEVVLWSYQCLKGLPEVHFENADELLPRAFFEACLHRGTPIVHLADHIRCLALSKHGGWFVDVDSLWLQPVLGVLETGVHGHLFASLRMRPDGRRNSRPYRYIKYLKEPMDFLSIASPFHLPKGSPLLPSLIRASTELVEAPTHKEYNSFMRALQTEVQAWGLEGAILEPCKFSPLPYWLGPQVVVKRAECFNGRLEVEWPDLLGQAIGVNAFWMSSRAGQQCEPRPEGKLPVLVSDSLWSSIAKKALEGGSVHLPTAGSELDPPMAANETKCEHELPMPASAAIEEADRMAENMMSLFPQVRAAQHSVSDAYQIIASAIKFWEGLLQRHGPVELSAFASDSAWSNYLLAQASAYWGLPAHLVPPWRQEFRNLRSVFLMGIGPASADSFDD